MDDFGHHPLEMEVTTAAARAAYPGRKIVVLPPDNVAKGIEEPDDMPVAPRKMT